MEEASASEDVQWFSALRGRFVVFDGPDGSGKTTQFHRFAHAVMRAGIEVCEVREPGGTAIGEQIRTVLLNPMNQNMTLRCEMLLYMASRTQLVDEKIAPARAAGRLVLADRFISSTLAYQGAAGGLDERDIMRVGEIALCGHWPDMIVVFDVDEQTVAKRLAASPRKQHKYVEIIHPTLFSDRLELKGAAYHRKVRQGYLEQARRDPQRYLVVDAMADVQTVYQRLTEGLRAKVAR